MIQKFRRKPVVVEMVQWNGENEHEIMNFVGSKLEYHRPPRSYEHDNNISNEQVRIFIPSREGDMKAIRTDWIVKGYNAELGIHFWVVADSYKAGAYELTEDQSIDYISLYQINDDIKGKNISGER